MGAFYCCPHASKEGESKQRKKDHRLGLTDCWPPPPRKVFFDHSRRIHSALAEFLGLAVLLVLMVRYLISNGNCTLDQNPTRAPIRLEGLQKNGESFPRR
jgi:hypothetical protein